MSAMSESSVELAHRDVDGHGRRLPSRRHAARLTSRPARRTHAADVDDHPGLLEDRDELCGPHDSTSRVAPPQQRLEAGDRHVGEVEDGLVHQEVLAGLGSFADPSRARDGSSTAVCISGSKTT